MTDATHHYKLIYFEKLRGRAEVIKVLCNLAGAKLDIENVKAEDWTATKPSKLVTGGSYT